MFPLLLLAATTALPQATNSLTAPAAPNGTAKPRSLFDIVAGRMSAQGRPIFVRYVQQTLVPQVRAQAQSEAGYRQQLRAVVAAPTLDVDAAQRLIDQRKRAEAASGDSIRTSAFAMIKSLPAADRKLALTAIFADARLQTVPAAAPSPAKSK